MLEVTLAIVAIVIAALAFMAPSLKRIRMENVDDLILAITEEYSRRVSKLEGRLVDLQVRLDILESQLEKGQRQKLPSSVVQKEGRIVMSQEDKNDITKPLERLGDLELSILKCIQEGAKSPSEVRSVVGRSREHVARALKELYERGFLDRRGGRPFIYSLSEKGRSALKSIGLSI